MNPADAAASYARAFLADGEIVRLVRSGNTTVYNALARVTDIVSQDLSGAVIQTRRVAIVLASDVVASGFPLPFKVKSDRVVWGGKSNVITDCNESARRIRGVLIAYVLDIEGA